MNKDLWEDTEAKKNIYIHLLIQRLEYIFTNPYREQLHTKTTAAVTFPAHNGLVKKQLKMLSNISLRLSITVVEGCISPWKKKKKQACGVQLNNKKWYNKQQHALRWINTSDMAADEAEPDKLQDRFQCGAV